VLIGQVEAREAPEFEPRGGRAAQPDAIEREGHELRQGVQAMKVTAQRVVAEVGASERAEPRELRRLAQGVAP
jgi:hypothetical protein